MEKNLRLTLFFFVLSMTLPLTAQNAQHQVQQGETFYSISRRYGISVEELLRLNNMTDPRQLRTGQVIKISNVVPNDEGQLDKDSEMVVTIQRGDTLFSLARRYRTTVEEIQKRNNITSPTGLRVGSQIIIQGVDPEKSPQNRQNQVSVSLSRLPLNIRPTPVNRPISGLLFRAPGGEFRAVNEGTVVFRDVFSGLGNLLLIESPDGFIYGYAGWTGSPVQVGEKISQNSILGRLSRDPPGSLLFFIYNKDGVLVAENYFKEN